MQRSPVLILNTSTKRDSGRKAQLSNIQAAKIVSEVVKTSLGPKSMYKMILSQSGSIIMTNDGHAILREIEVSHPSAKSMIELSKSQDQEVGDGTTSVIILAGELLTIVEPWIQRNIHPRILIGGFLKALDDALLHMRSIAITIDIKNKSEIVNIVRKCMDTKFVSSLYPAELSDIAVEAVQSILVDHGDRREIDIKRFIRIEKIPGGQLSDCALIPGVVLNKDVTHSKMRRVIEKPRIVLLDCNLEYKKGDNQTSIDVSKPEHWEEILRQEEEYIKEMCDNIISVKPDLVFTEKGISDLAQHYLLKNNITAIRRLKKTDNDRLARATGATIVNRPEDLKEGDVGTRCNLFEIKKIGDEYFTFVTCDKAKACTILLRGSGKDLLGEIERNLQDALAVARNVILEPLLLPGGGATEMSVATKLMEKSKSIPGIEQYSYHSVGIALEVIPRTLIQNSGANVMKTLTGLRAKHASGSGPTWGINGETGKITDIKDMGLWEPFVVKTQTIKTAIEASCVLLRVDDILSGLTSKESKNAPQGGAPPGMGGMMPGMGGMPDMD